MWVQGSCTCLLCTPKICGNPEDRILPFPAGAWGGAQGISASSPRTTIRVTRSGAGSRWRAGRLSARRCVKHLPTNLWKPLSCGHLSVWYCVALPALHSSSTAVATMQCAQTTCRGTVMHLLCHGDLGLPLAVVIDRHASALTLLGHVREAFLFCCAGPDGRVQQAEQVPGVHAPLGK